MSANVKQELRDIADALPDGATWDDVMEEVRFRKAVAVGIAAADRGAFASPEELRAAFARWGVNVKD